MFWPFVLFFFPRWLLCFERQQVLDHKRSRCRRPHRLCQDKPWSLPKRHHCLYSGEGKFNQMPQGFYIFRFKILSKQLLFLQQPNVSVIRRECRDSPQHRSSTNWAWGDPTPVSWSLKTVKSQVCWNCQRQIMTWIITSIHKTILFVLKSVLGLTLAPPVWFHPFLASVKK